MTMQRDHARETVVLSAEQFDKLVELLTPGYELAKMYFAQQQAAAEPDGDKPKGKKKAEDES